MMTTVTTLIFLLKDLQMSKHKLCIVWLCLYTHIKINNTDTFRVRQSKANRGGVDVAIFTTENMEFKAQVFK